MKHLHMLTALITLVLFGYQAVFVLSGRQLVLSRAFKGLSHLVYLLLVMSGLYLFWQLLQVVGVQYWAIIKLGLLIVAISSTIKALRPTNQAIQSRAGIIIALIAYVAIIALALTKPTLM
ncbi:MULTISPECIES: SirB2 family protein [unclassified Moraxella]|uniref:SirB2 family protein n=1 Tax=unclassified Moraxella TaxID=2685852 RepID=UPI00359D6A89